ncbi:MAG: ATP-binding cassette domain-containing protein, partial [Spirochaetales bacterium]|nr:ATP-binding cassette domain-containing protein [Spirochaetales bacterium]
MKYDSSAPPLVQMKKISCLNDGNKVLRNLSLTLYPGQIHAVVGDHGSGKSYISDVLSGIHPVHSGELYLEGRKVNPLSIKKSQDFGIQTVHQDVSLIQNFNLAENLFTPELPDQSFPFQKSKRLQIAEEILKGYGVYISPEKLYKDLNLSEKILINIIRVLLRSPRLLILDEALEKLTGRDYECLINILNGHIDRGMSILCLSHKIDEVYNFADSVSIIRKGEIFLNDSMDSIDRLNLVKLCYSQLNYDSNINDLSKEFYQLLKYNEAILQKLPINLIVTDDSGRIKMINDAGRKFFNLHAREFRDKSLRELFLEEKEGFIHALEDALAGQTETSLYNMRLTMSSSKRIVNFRTLPIYDGAFLIGNIIILEDISEQEKLREQINLSEKLASVGLLAAGVLEQEGDFRLGARMDIAGLGQGAAFLQAHAVGQAAPD